MNISGQRAADSRKRILVGGSIFISACCLLSAASCLSHAQLDTPRVCFKDACYSVEIARTPEALERGLMERDGLPAGTGMLFVFDVPGRHVFWMKNMKFLIDILWLDDEGKVVHVAQNAPPCAEEPCAVYAPPSDAKYVLEIPAADAAKLGISLSEKARLEAIEP
jgi:uncharacterized protein